MNTKFLIVLTIFVVLAAWQSAPAQTKRPKKKTPTKPAAQTIEKIVYEPDAELLRELRGKVRVVESKKDWAQFKRQAPRDNPTRTRSAYIAQFAMENEPDALLDVIVVSDNATDKMFEIRGIEDFPWRPFSEFKWIDADVLQFEQWVNPNNGGRYQVNLKTGKIVAAGYVRSN